MRSIRLHGTKSCRVASQALSLLRSGSQGGLAKVMYFTLAHTDSIWGSKPLNHLTEEMFTSLCLTCACAARFLWRDAGIAMNRTAMCLTNYVCVPEGLKNSNKLGLIVCLHKKKKEISALQPETHQSTPRTLLVYGRHCSQNTNTLLLLYSRFSTPYHTHTHTCAHTRT